MLFGWYWSLRASRARQTRRPKIVVFAMHKSNNNNLVWWHCHPVTLHKMEYKLKSESYVRLTNYLQHPFQHRPSTWYSHIHIHMPESANMTVMPWTTSDEFILIPKPQQMSLTSNPGQNIYNFYLSSSLKIMIEQSYWAEKSLIVIMAALYCLIIKILSHVVQKTHVWTTFLWSCNVL